MKLTIIRQLWLRGEGHDESYLLRKSDNKMCCVGFYCLARGFTLKDILGISTYHAAYLLKKGTEDKEGGFDLRAIFSVLYRINDDMKLSEEEREAKLSGQFKKLGVEVEFVDGPPPSRKQQLIEESDDFGLAELTCGHTGFPEEAGEDGTCVNCMEEAGVQ